MRAERKPSERRLSVRRSYENVAEPRADATQCPDFGPTHSRYARIPGAFRVSGSGLPYTSVQNAKGLLLSAAAVRLDRR